MDYPIVETNILLMHVKNLTELENTLCNKVIANVRDNFS